MTKILGLTGGIACGKSTVSQYFKTKEIPVVDADVGAREVVAKGKPALDKIRQQFGEKVIQEDEELNRKALWNIILKDKQNRKALDALLDPYIRNWILTERDNLLKENQKLIVLDIPLLYEANYDQEVDEVMVVYVDETVQLERLMQRDELSKEEAQKRMNAQMSLEEKKAKADILINNNGSKEETYKQLDDWLNQQEHGYN